MADSYRFKPGHKRIEDGRNDSAVSTDSSRPPTIILNDGTGAETPPSDRHSIQPVEPLVSIQDELNALRLLLAQGNADAVVHSL